MRYHLEYIVDGIYAYQVFTTAEAATKRVSNIVKRKKKARNIRLYTR